MYFLLNPTLEPVLATSTSAVDQNGVGVGSYCCDRYCDRILTLRRLPAKLNLEPDGRADIQLA